MRDICEGVKSFNKRGEARSIDFFFIGARMGMAIVRPESREIKKLYNPEMLDGDTLREGQRKKNLRADNFEGGKCFKILQFYSSPTRAPLKVIPSPEKSALKIVASRYIIH